MLYTAVLGPILAMAEGCPSILAVDALRNACIEFCKRSRCLTTGAQVTLDGTESASFGLAEQVVDIIDAEVDGEPIIVTDLNDPVVKNLRPGEYALRFTDPNNAELLPAPTIEVPVTLDLLLSIAPGPESTEMRPELWRRYSEALRHGALFRLYAQPNKPWSQPTSVGYHQGEFEREIATATEDAARNRSQRARRLRVKPA